jgi:hypothetical protein
MNRKDDPTPIASFLAMGDDDDDFADEEEEQETEGDSGIGANKKTTSTTKSRRGTSAFQTVAVGGKSSPTKSIDECDDLIRPVRREVTGIAPTNEESPITKRLRRQSSVSFISPSCEPKKSIDDNFIPHLVQQNDENDFEGEDGDLSENPFLLDETKEKERTELEKAQMEVVQKIRFVPPRSVAPSQLEEVIRATCSVAQSSDDNFGTDRLMLPSERGNVSLKKLLEQQKQMIHKLEADRPAYEAMMNRSVDLLEQQRKAMEERYKDMS